jgi:hypothetical protein
MGLDVVVDDAREAQREFVQVASDGAAGGLVIGVAQAVHERGDGDRLRRGGDQPQHRPLAVEGGVALDFHALGPQVGWGKML